MENLQKFYPIQTGENNPILRKVSVEIKNIDDDIKEFGEELIELMQLYDGAGLAAPQVGRNIRMIATTQWKETKNSIKLLSKILMINPKIIEKSKDIVVSEEACLSIPNFKGKVKRYKYIVVEYLDLDGKLKKKKLKDLDAFIVQHEYDHLDGVLFIDKIIKNSGKSNVKS
ncbi:peptide deformylase [Candidatus Gracilibacteria bacterium]|nr:peptide deformylase [Candidatus Gracilibacteria bacterium]